MGAIIFFDDKRLFVLVNREEMTTFTAFPFLLHLSREIEHSIGYHTHDYKWVFITKDYKKRCAKSRTILWKY